MTIATLLIALIAASLFAIYSIDKSTRKFFAKLEQSARSNKRFESIQKEIINQLN